jgi:hypothetical protein
LAWLLPLFARSLAGHALIPIAPLVTLLLLADIARRVVGTREQFALENAQQNPHLASPVKERARD